jgi:hypothetical protein
MKIWNIEGFSELQPKTKNWLKDVAKEFELDEHHMRLLVLAGCSYDRALEAKRTVDAESAVIEDRFQQKKAHPAVEIQKQASITFCRLLRETGLDLAGPDDSRPYSRPGGY